MIAMTKTDRQDRAMTVYNLIRALEQTSAMKSGNAQPMGNH
jgi:hypothetical protein